MRMQEASNNAPEAAGLLVLLAKFLPAGIGAALIIAVDTPKTLRELFARVFVAFACSYLFGEAIFDFLDSTAMFGFLDWSKRGHHTAVDGLVGAFGWFVVGGLTGIARRFKRQPFKVAQWMKKFFGSKP